MVKVKICGITHLEDAQAAVKAGCDALGFVFYPESPRYITPVEARHIIRVLPARTVTVGVFVNAREQAIRRIKQYCGLSMVQFHGNESPAFCSRFKGFKVIKAFRIKSEADTEKVSRYDTFGYLFDSFSPGNQGGTGKCFDWSIGETTAGARKVFFVSGGLTVANVREAITRFKPHWVDVSTGVEAAPGKKDAGKIRDFIRAAKARKN
jgi:phosphoribosylanthranilate isomerase